jgi:hypothetical protein
MVIDHTELSGNHPGGESNPWNETKEKADLLLLKQNRRKRTKIQSQLEYDILSQKENSPTH